MVVLFPTLNPDGLDEVVHWYRRTVGTEYEAWLLRLYQLYTGHDNNRDWFMLTQQETKLVTRELYQRWFPQVYWDVHQQGGTRERFFVPPFRDPLNPNLDPAIITGIDALGSRALHDLTAAGFTGVSTGVSYDMWWNGGNRNVPVRHNVIGLLTEAASADLATPTFLQRRDPQARAASGPTRPPTASPIPGPAAGGASATSSSTSSPSARACSAASGASRPSGGATSWRPRSARSTRDAARASGAGCCRAGPPTPTRQRASCRSRWTRAWRSTA